MNMKMKKIAVGAFAAAMAATSLCSFGVNASTVKSANNNVSKYTGANSWSTPSNWQNKYGFINPFAKNITKASLVTGETSYLSNSWVKYTWNEVENATGYRVQLASDMKFTDIGYDEIVKECKYSSSCGKLQHGAIFMRVKPIFGENEGVWGNTVYFKGTSSAKSPYGTIRNTAVKPKITQNCVENKTRKINVEWTPVTGATGYLVKYGDSNTGDVKLWHSKYVSGNKFQINSKAYSLAGASVDYMLYNTYYFQVEPVFGNMDGIASETINAPSNY